MKNFIKRYRFIIVIFLLILFGIAGYKTYEYIKLQKLINTPVNELTEEQKLEDFEYLYNVIVENYPLLEVNKRKYGVDWVANKEKYIEFIKQEPDFKLALEQIVSELNNSHTSILSKGFVEKLVYYYQNISIFSWRQMHLDILDNPLVQARYGLDIDSNLYLNTDSQFMKNYKSNAVVQDIVEDKVASIYIPEMISYDDIEQDRKLITEYLSKVKDYQALVIDIRGNDGGDSSYWQYFLLPLLLKEQLGVKTYTFYKDGELVEEYLKKSRQNTLKVDDLDLSRFPNLSLEISEDFTYYTENNLDILPSEEDYIGFDGNIYLFVDSNVYSSSESLAVYAKESGFATIIGQQTGGDGIGTEPLITMLPNSGYIFRFSKEMGITSDGTCNEEYGTTPDYIVPSAKFPEEYINLDECVRKVLELEEIDISEIK
mgnify:CR=1 FL=1